MQTKLALNLGPFLLLLYLLGAGECPYFVLTLHIVNAYMYKCVCTGMQRTEDARPLGTEVSGHCEPPNLGTRN